MKDSYHENQEHLTAKLSPSTASRILAVGDISLVSGVSKGHADIGELCFRSIDAVDAATLDQIRPNLVLSPVVAPQFDCLDLAVKLHACRFSGAYRAVARSMPDTNLIRREIMGLCPGLDFDIISLPVLAPDVIVRN